MKNRLLLFTLKQFFLFLPLAWLLLSYRIDSDVQKTTENLVYGAMPIEFEHLKPGSPERAQAVAVKDLIRDVNELKASADRTKILSELLGNPIVFWLLTLSAITVFFWDLVEGSREIRREASASRILS